MPGRKLATAIDKGGVKGIYCEEKRNVPVRRRPWWLMKVRNDEVEEGTKCRVWGEPGSGRRGAFKGRWRVSCVGWIFDFGRGAGFETLNG